MQCTRRNFLKTSGLATAASLGPWAAILDPRAAKADYTMQEIRNNVGFFTERGGTIGWMINKEGIVVVDSQFPDQATHLIEAIKAKSERQIDLLLNTHHHGDHSGGNIAFKGLVQQIVAHENSKANQERVAKARKQEDQQLYPTATFKKYWSRNVGGETVTMMYFGPGHTNGDSVIQFENANVVHMGDLMFNRRFPYIDRSAGANIKNWISILEEVSTTFDDETIYIFGHAFDPVKITGTKDDLLKMRDYFTALLDFVIKEMKEGKSKEEIAKATAIPGVTEWQGKGIQRSLTSAYEELSE